MMQDRMDRPEISGRFFLCLMVSSLLHLGVLAFFAPDTYPWPGMADPAALHVTFVRPVEPILQPADAAVPSRIRPAPLRPTEPAPAIRTPATAPPPAPIPPEQSLPATAEPVYFSASQVSRSAYPLAEPRLRSPEFTSYPITGEIEVRLHISAQGRVVQAEIIASTLLERHAEHFREAFLNIPFEPAQQDGHPVASVLQVVVGVQSFLPKKPQGTGIPKVIGKPRTLD